MAALLALLNFPFYKSVIVYALAFMTFALVMSVKYGFKKDREEAEKKLLSKHYVESEYIRITAEAK
jgi:NADH:ubiquinone oxidoreductase subunit 6 (subunit J)